MSHAQLAPLDTKRPAVILGVEHPRGLAVLRSLAGTGITVVVVDRYETAPGLYSPLAQRRLLLDTDDPEETLRFLEALEGVDGAILIPTNDFYMALVATNIARLARRFVLTTPPGDVLEPVLNKASLYRLAQSASVATPVFHAPDTFEDLEDILTRLDYQERGYVFSLPPTSPEPADPETVRFTTPAGKDRETARARAAEIFSRAGVVPMIQELIPGDADHCVGVVMLLDDDHRPIGSRAVRRRKLYPYFNIGGRTYGGNVACESVLDAEAVAVATVLVARARLTGIVTVEFRRQLDGRLVLMKVDPRVVAMVGLCNALDFDVATLLYRLRTGQSVAVSNAYPEGLVWVWEKPFVLGMFVPHPVLWTQVNATPPGVARAPRGPRSACDTRASRAARSCCTAPRTRSLRRVPP